MRERRESQNLARIKNRTPPSPSPTGCSFPLLSRTRAQRPATFLPNTQEKNHSSLFFCSSLALALPTRFPLGLPALLIRQFLPLSLHRSALACFLSLRSKESHTPPEEKSKAVQTRCLLDGSCSRQHTTLNNNTNPGFPLFPCHRDRDTREPPLSHLEHLSLLIFHPEPCLDTPTKSTPPRGILHCFHLSPGRSLCFFAFSLLSCCAQILSFSFVLFSVFFSFSWTHHLSEETPGEPTTTLVRGHRP
ncbi:hypothetical protein VTJ49DRAFT_4894 [Mycothermus thermophilus]|uniref:Transmembrane protein n=1 Tax=Humicola insolens TaxID=85995 RepID=A0ABR3V4P8_HUMIN